MRLEWPPPFPFGREQRAIVDLFRLAPGSRERRTGGKVLLGGGLYGRVIVVLGSGPDGDWVLRLDNEGLALGDAEDGPKRIVADDSDVSSLAIYRVLDPLFVLRNAIEPVRLFDSRDESEALVTYSVVDVAQEDRRGSTLPNAYVDFLGGSERTLLRTANLRFVGGIVREMSQPDVAARGTDRIIERFRNWDEMTRQERSTYTRFV